MTRSGRIAAITAAALGLGLSALSRPALRLIWNASASVPIGLYAVHPAGTLHVNELLVVMPPEPLATFLDERRNYHGSTPFQSRSDRPTLAAWPCLDAAAARAPSFGSVSQWRC
jgi:type IV secretory pathway protease TraF